LQKVDVSIKACQALIIASTQNDALEIQKIILSIGQFVGIKCHACIEEASIGDDIEVLEVLEESYHIVVGTYGRISDLIANKIAFKTNNVKMFVIDGADEIWYNMFCDRIKTGFQNLLEDTQLVLVSSNLSDEYMLKFAEWLMRTPILILVKRDDVVIKGKQL